MLAVFQIEREMSNANLPELACLACLRSVQTALAEIKMQMVRERSPSPDLLPQEKEQPSSVSRFADDRPQVQSHEFPAVLAPHGERMR